MNTIATLLSGGEGVGVGARAAGLRHIWGIENDPKIASVAQTNGFDLIVARIQDVDPATLEVPDVLHASPECQRASSARQADEGGRESVIDRDIGDCICRYIEILRPRIFTLENVYGYRHFDAFKQICATLDSLGYFYHYANLNAADFGVPQTRRRLILRSVRGGLLPELPAPEPWVGWYEAIEDLIPSLPESRFAPWQLKRLRINGDMLVDSTGYVDGNGRLPVQRESHNPANTVLSNHAGRGMRAFIVPGGNMWTPPTDEDTPVFTQQSSSHTLQSRAFIVGGQFGQPDTGNGKSRPPQQADGGKPIFCVTAVNKDDWKAWLSQGRVVKMTSRCLARFQSFPDSYILPENNTLACRIIGNAVPPLLYTKIIRQLIS